jgi:hypothetical protein
MAIHQVLNTTALNVPFENEPFDGPQLGGACVLRMILNSAKVDAAAPSVPNDGTEANQLAMFNIAKASNNPSEPANTWDLDPRAVRLTLNALDTGTPSTRIYVEDAYTSQASMNYQLMYTLWNYQIAPALLTFAGKQWVAVTGFDSDGATPQRPGASFGNLQAIYLHDPSFYGPGTAFHFETADSWNSTYLKDPIDKGTQWKGKYVAVCDPPPPLMSATSAARRPKRNGAALLKPAEAVDLALAGAREWELQREEQVKIAVDRGRPGDPRLVYRADERDSYYYIVPLQTGDGASRGNLGAVIVDARFGDLRSMVAAREPFPLFQLTPDDVRKRLTSQRIDIYDSVEASRTRVRASFEAWADRLTTEPASELRARVFGTIDRELAMARQPIDRAFLRPETLEISSLFWWDCTMFSMNAFYPYYVVRSAALKLYVRAVDGLIISDFLPCEDLRLGG